MHSRKELANAIRMLSIDAVQKANSGHPGTPMGMADIAEVLWRNYLNHNPYNPHWINRDRFVLSNGHASILLYSLLHLTGYQISIDDIKNFRKINSNTPGHPEYGETFGVETTTGPLGQGMANAVGFAIAEKTLSAQFNRKNYNIIDHNTYVFVGDGCMMEGISHEVCSLAGTLKLGKLIVFYDDNNISIDGNVSGWFTDNTSTRFKGYGWHVIENINGHDSKEIEKSIEQAKKKSSQPSLLICKTIIGFGSPNKAGTHHAHGAPLGEKEVLLTRKQLGWIHPPFYLPASIYKKWNATIAGIEKEKKWNTIFKKYEKEYPELAIEFKRRTSSNLPNKWNENTKNFITKLYNKPENISTRTASQKVIEEFSSFIPEYLIGSADLAPSNLTMCSKSKPIHKYIDGNYIHYGVREFGMTAIANGIALHGGFLPCTGTFLIFLEYAKNAVRMAALMKIRQILIYTHDSIGLGEDGPTHQPIEQISNLRYTPNVSVWRPCDQIECAIAWKCAIERKDGPTALILSRQNLIQQDRTIDQLHDIEKGGYILKDSDTVPELILIATGSEVILAMDAYKILIKKGYKIRVVSMPCTDVFDKQNIDYQTSVLPINKRLAIEASSKDFWYKYVGLKGYIIGMSSFGKSASSKELFECFHFTVDNIVKQAKILLHQDI